MDNSQLRLQGSSVSVPLAELEKEAEGWLLSGEISQHSPATRALRRLVVKHLVWFLRREGCSAVGVSELRAFFAYLSRKPEPGGRFGNPRLTQSLKPRSVKDYHGALRTLFRWLVAEGLLSESPMERIPPPIDRPDQVQPFTDAQVDGLLSAARQSRQSRRDEAILLFLLDTGCRASELCALRFRDLEMTVRKVTVEGKGGKARALYFGPTTARALFTYLRLNGRDPDDPLFQSERGEALTRNGLLQLIRRVGKVAGITAARCSPHTFRHTFSVSYLRTGGNQFALMQILGHTNIQMTARYVAIAQADVAASYRQFSPVESLKKGKQK
jgi:integrase/recombinase XerD